MSFSGKLPSDRPLDSDMRAGLLILLLISGVLFPERLVRADVPVPPSVLSPASAAEAWNVIRLATGNVGRLLQEKRFLEIAEQISLCSPSLRLLAQSPVAQEQKQRVDEQTALAFRHVNSIAQAAMAQSGPDAVRVFGELQATLRGLGRAFDDKIVSGEIYQCRTHTDIVSQTDGTRCKLCDAPLIVRRIPYSFIYVETAQPTTKLSLLSDSPLVAGSKTEVRIRLQTLAGTAVIPGDLIIMHAHPVHLYVADAQFGDFHHVQPAATETPGDYVFTFTPGTSGPHRLWADVVPVSTGLQEQPFADIGGQFAPSTPESASNKLTGEAGGLLFHVALARGVGGQVRARQIQYLKLTVTDAARQPITRLEPLMNAYAHLVGIYEDGQTVIRLHPIGGDILRDDVRGGPALGFKIFPPKTGFIRFHCEVKVDGKTLAAPLAIQVTE